MEKAYKKLTYNLKFMPHYMYSEIAKNQGGEKMATTDATSLTNLLNEPIFLLSYRMLGCHDTIRKGKVQIGLIYVLIDILIWIFIRFNQKIQIDHQKQIGPNGRFLNYSYNIENVRKCYNHK